MRAVRQSLSPNDREAALFVFPDTPTLFVYSGVGGKANVVADTPVRFLE